MEKKGKDNQTRYNFTRREFIKTLAAGLGTMALSACAPKLTETVPPTAVPPTSVPAVPATDIPPTIEPTAPPQAPAIVTLSYQNHWTKETDAHYKGMEWLYKEFEAQNPQVKIDNILNPDSIESTKKILADCAAGDCPDIIHGPGPEMWSAHYLLDLKPYIDKDPAWKDILVASTLYTTGGHIWGLCAEFSPMPVIWNTRILDQAGVSEIPATWDELLDVCEKVKKIGKIPTSWAVGGAHQWHDIIASQDGGLEALAQNHFDAPQIREAFTRLKTFVDNKWIPDNEIELTWQQSVALFVAEETAFYLNGSWTLGNEIRSEGAAPDLQEHVKFAPFPAVGTNGTVVELKKTTAIGISAALEKDPAKLDAALKLMKFWFSEEGGKQWILLTQSPMGVKEDLSKIQGVDPLLLSFLGVKDKANLAYSLPDTPAMQERGWDDCWSGLQTLMSGKSVDDAMTAYTEEMSKYHN